jgi:glycosyltransferase involved in cell wall biosynthesis
VGIFWSYLCGGGVETVNRDIAEGLSREKYIVDAYVWQALDTFVPLAEAFDELIVLNEGFEAFTPQERTGPFTPIEQCAGFQRFLMEREYDAFIISCAWGPFWVTHMHGIPIVEYWHGYGCWNSWAMPSQAIVAVSETTLRQIEVHRPDHAPATVIRNAIKYERYGQASERRAEARRRFGLQPDAPVMLYCGRFSAEKRPEDAMKAFVKAREQQPDLQLLMVGTCLASEYFVRLGQQIGLRWGVDAWHYMLPHDEVVLAYAAADVMVHPSDWEGLGMVLLEAMAAGVPIVSTFAGGCAEVLRGLAIAVDVGDTDAMAAGALKLLRDKRTRAKAIKGGQKRIREEFSLAGNVAALEVVLDGVMEQRPALRSPQEMHELELQARRIAAERLCRRGCESRKSL